jgi:hypothetical protein
VFNLRNRVRLLELEHKRAIKKISEASQRAQHMADLKSKNDQKFMEVRILKYLNCLIEDDA